MHVTQWLYQEVENRTVVQVSHVKVLALRHYLVILHSMEDRHCILVGGPYYMRKRMIYTTPWEPGFDTHKVLAKKMAVWLDLLNVDPMMEAVGTSLLGSLGSVLQVAGVTEKQEGKFANIRGCILMDMTQPLPTVLALHMNNEKAAEAVKKAKDQGDDYIEVKGKGKGAAAPKELAVPEEENQFEVLGQTDEEEMDEVNKPGAPGVQQISQDQEDEPIQEEADAGTEAGEGTTQHEDKQQDQEELPDLNVTPQEGSTAAKDKGGKKKNKKARQREKRREEKMKKDTITEGGTSPINQGLSPEGKGGDSSSSEEDTEGDNRLWQSIGGKKSRGEVEVMETTADYARNELGGAALIIHETLKVITKGVKESGNMAWAVVETQGRQLIVASVYGPHRPEEEIQFFNWLRDKADGGDWILLGDWNMVLSPTDSLGPTPMLKGSPLQAWTEVELKWSFEDALEVALQTQGPKFTRQAVRGSRLDQSRLDRVYINKNAAWLKEVTSLNHDGKEALSDHTPVMLVVNLTSSNSSRKGRRKKDTYTKMDVDSMQNPTRRKIIQEAWEEGWGISSDPVLAWEFAWSKAREVFKQFHKEDREKVTKLQALQDNLGDIRERLHVGASEREMEDYRKMEQKVHETELLEASILRRRSRIQWVKEGDVSSRYFFNCLKSKQQQERITSLLDNEGRKVEDEDGKLKLAHDYYQKLFSQEPDMLEIREERRTVLNLLDRGVKDNENAELSAVPDAEEVTELVKKLPVVYEHKPLPGSGLSYT
ncbi:hypothetical protein R1sor_003743 [Riccia sorocarpa]|uniref:Endonuclease/exonuclease/phosphatase domain-containing protein n=1 Tax=Riccia sorocarpa TaxID=122646 RepID=A0ABD3H6K1_9MARC